MELFNNLNLKSKFAFLFFILGKLSFLPTTYFLFTKQFELTKISLSIYSLFIVLSLTLSFFSIRSKSINLSLVSKKIKCNKTSSDTFVIKIKDGKIVEVI